MTTFDLASTAVHLDDDASMTSHQIGDDLWANRSDPPMSAGRLVSVFSYTESWTYKERHPEGDEFAALLEGQVDLILESDHGEDRVALSPGDGSIIPAGWWHRLEIQEPSILLFITPTPATTEHVDLGST